MTRHVKEEKVSRASKNRRQRQKIGSDECYRAVRARNTVDQELAAVHGPGLGWQQNKNELRDSVEHSIMLIRQQMCKSWGNKAMHTTHVWAQFHECSDTTQNKRLAREKRNREKQYSTGYLTGFI